MCEGKTENRNERNIMILFLSNFLFNDLNKDKRTPEGGKLPPKYVRKTAACYEISRWNGEQKETIFPECLQTNEAPIKDVLFNLNGKPLDAVFCIVSEKVGGRGDFAGKKVYVWESSNAAEPQEYNNHIELFWERLQNINADEALRGMLDTPLTQDKFHMVEFNESADDPSAECIRATLDLEDKIKYYMEHEADAEGNKLSMHNCNLYADITGGMRTANMAMSAAVQLLQYDGAHLKRVVYSDYAEGRNPNPVSNVQPINDLYKLVAGVYAFTRYGRSEALKDYFEDETYVPLIELRQAMDDFSEAVQLCQEKAFEEALGSLMGHLESFSKEAENEPNKSAKVALFTRMVPNLKSVYSDLLEKDRQGRVLKDGQGHYKTNRLKIIRWCVDNKLLQQAVTFCTEWLPEFLIHHGVVYVEDSGIQNYLKQQGKREKDPVGKEYFLRIFLSDNINVSQIHSKSKYWGIKKLIERQYKEEQETNPLPQEFVSMFNQFWKSIPDELQKLKNDYPVQNAMMNILIDDLVNIDHMEQKNITKDSLKRKLLKWAKNCDKYFCKAPFNLPEDMYTAENVEYIPKDQSGNAARRAKALFHIGLLKTCLTEADKKDAVYYIEEYTYIRARLRNKINHADTAEDNPSIQDKAKMEVEDIARYLTGYLDNLELLKEKRKPHFTGLWDENETWKKEEASK